jgi:hypothetical protein
MGMAFGSPYLVTRLLWVVQCLLRDIEGRPQVGHEVARGMDELPVMIRD